MRPPVIIDIEASGFGADSYPIEVGAVLSDGRRFSCLIKPFADWTYWSDEAESVHQISRRLLDRCGCPGGDVARRLNQFLCGMQAYSDAWVVDKPWLDKLFYRAGVTRNFQLSPIEALLPEAQLDCWDDTKMEVIRQLNVRRHRASTDALIIQQTYVTSRQRLAVG